jgi:hypothetical protein
METVWQHACSSFSSFWWQFSRPDLLDADCTIGCLLVLPAFSVEEFGWRGRDRCREFVKRGIALYQQPFTIETEIF